MAEQRVSGPALARIEREGNTGLDACAPAGRAARRAGR